MRDGVLFRGGAVGLLPSARSRTSTIRCYDQSDRGDTNFSGALVPNLRRSAAVADRFRRILSPIGLWKIPEQRCRSWKSHSTIESSTILRLFSSRRFTKLGFTIQNELQRFIYPVSHSNNEKLFRCFRVRLSNHSDLIGFIPHLLTIVKPLDTKPSDCHFT